MTTATLMAGHVDGCECADCGKEWLRANHRKDAPTCEACGFDKYGKPGLFCWHCEEIAKEYEKREQTMQTGYNWVACVYPTFLDWEQAAKYNKQRVSLILVGGKLLTVAEYAERTAAKVRMVREIVEGVTAT